MRYKNGRNGCVGRILSEDTKRKISEASNRFGHFTRYNQIRSSLPGYVNPMKGKKRPDLSERNKRIDRNGEKNPNWNGGINPILIRLRSLFEYRQWRSDVYTRDNFICQDCGRKGTDAHHIVRFVDIVNKYNIRTIEEGRKCPELWNINNGITLCELCHNKTRAKSDANNC